MKTPRLALYCRSHLSRDLYLKKISKNAEDSGNFPKLVLHSSFSKKNQTSFFPHMVALEMLSGQRCIITRAKKSIAQFQLRKGNLVGCKVTLRKAFLFQFLEVFCTLFLPKLTDDVSLKGIGKCGSFSFGYNNFFLFPQLEATYDLFDTKLQGFESNLVFHTKAKCTFSFKKRMGVLYLSALQVPITYKKS